MFQEAKLYIHTHTKVYIQNDKTKVKYLHGGNLSEGYTGTLCIVFATFL